MEHIKLAIITQNEEYGRALSIGLVGLYRNFAVTLYLAQNLGGLQYEDYDLVLWDSKAPVPEHGILLAEKPSLVRLDREAQDFILYKYENVRVLAGHLLLIYGIRTGRKVVRLQNADMNLLLFVSSEGGAGCTTAAMAAAQELRRFYHKRVLYLSLEEIESTFQYMKVFPQSKGISEYLYFLFSEQERDCAGPFLESFLVMDDYGVEAFAPSAGKNLLTGLSAEEMQYFISTLMNAGRYDYIIMDVGCRLDQNVLCCYEMANRICLVGRQGQALGKEQKFLEYLMFLKGEKLVSKMAKIENFYQKDRGQREKVSALTAPMVNTAVRLEQDENSFLTDGSDRRILLDGRFGLGICSLAAMIVNHSWN